MYKFYKGLSFIALLLIVSCNKHEFNVKDDETGKSTNVKISQNPFDKKIEVTSKEDGSTLTIQEGHNNMPDFVKSYPGASEASSIHASQKGEHEDVNMLSFQTNDDIPKVIDFYKKDFTENGYKENANVNMGALTIASYLNEATKENLQLMATKADGKTTVQIIYTKDEH